MPNATNLLPALQNVDFDPGRAHSLTWQSGFGGLGLEQGAGPRRPAAASPTCGSRS